MNYSQEVELFRYDNLVRDVLDARSVDSCEDALRRWLLFIEKSTSHTEYVAEILSSPQSQALLEDLTDRKDHHDVSAVYGFLKYKNDIGVIYLAMINLVHRNNLQIGENLLRRQYKRENLPRYDIQIVKEMFLPLTDRFREVITEKSDQAAESTPKTAPASDRMVNLDHNQPDVKAFADDIGEIERQISRLNDFGNTPDEQRVKAELVAANHLFEPSQLDLNIFNKLIRSVLNQLKRIARFMGDKVLGGLIVQAATHWEKIYAFLLHLL